MILSKEILLNNNFKYVEQPLSLKELYDKESWHEYNIMYTNQSNNMIFSIVITENISNYIGRNWNAHVDNAYFESIGSASVETTEQFNLLMECLGIDLRL